MQSWLLPSFNADVKAWQAIFKSDDPWSYLEMLMDSKRSDEDIKVTEFQKILILLCLRKEVVPPQIRNFIRDSLGARHVEPFEFSLSDSFARSYNCAIPLILFVSPIGGDPVPQLCKFANVMKNGEKLKLITLGHDDEDKAKSGIEEAVDRGFWVCLENLHLLSGWMGELQNILDTIRVESECVFECVFMYLFVRSFFVFR